MGLFNGPWLSKEEHEQSIHLNLISRVNMLEMNNSELQAKLEMARGRIAELEQEIDDYQTIYKGSVVEAQAKRIEELEDAFREIYEVYAGSDGFIPETCPEAYQQQLIKEMAEIAAKHMRKGLGEKQ